MSRAVSAPLAVLGLALLGSLASCSDPVRDATIQALGDEDPNVPLGPDHRPGTPCLVCHSPGGPAESHFAVAGTVYESTAPNAKGAEGYEVRFVDARNRGPRGKVITSASGNFFVPASAWSVSYPFRVALFKDDKVDQVMTTTVNREGSCNHCHRPNADPEKLTDQDRELGRRYFGQIYVRGTP